MTTAEAINILRERAAFWEARYNDKVPEYYDALVLAIRALRRQQAWEQQRKQK